MEPADLLRSMTPTIHPSQPNRASSVIEDAWGLVFAQGGVVMAAMLRAAEDVLARDDLRLRATSAVFCRPVPCGSVISDVDVVRNGRSGAQVAIRLTTEPSDPLGKGDHGPNAVATAVFTADDPSRPPQVGLEVPAGLVTPPADTTNAFGGPATGGLGGEDHGMNFLRQTLWSPSEIQADDPMRRLVWFRFLSTPLVADGSWEPSALLVPGDALGLAFPAELHTGGVSSVSLQISAQFFGPARGDWIGIDSTCFHLSGVTASGLTNLWDEQGELVASVTQTAMLR